MENQPTNNEEWQHKIDTELSTDGILNAPLEGDDYIAFGKRLQDQIEKSPQHLQSERAHLAQRRIEEHFMDHYDRIAFINTNEVVILHRDIDPQLNRFERLEDVSMSGELKRVELMQSDEAFFLVLQLANVSIYGERDSDGKIGYNETSSPALVPICSINHHDLI
jgi:hypothetical protein